MKFVKIFSLFVIFTLFLTTAHPAYAEGDVLKYVGTAFMIGSAMYICYLGEQSVETRDLRGAKLIGASAALGGGWLLLKLGSKKAEATKEKKVGIIPVINLRQKLYGLAVSVRF